MSRRRKEPEHENHERWMVSYADFVTLLFAFFVVLYASAQVDTKKMAQVAAAIAGGFQELGVFTGNTRGPAVQLAGVAGNKVMVVPGSSIGGTAGKQNSGDANSGGLVNVAKLKKELEDALAPELKNNEVQLRMTPDGLVLSLKEMGFFNSGEATLLPGAETTLARIAGILGSKGYEIRVEGHTDNIPIHSSRFRSNWELSTARATEVVSILIERYQFDPQRVAVAGYSEYRPIANNSTEDGRKVNRRVDLVVVAKH
jgi:chemotaxis protein MotB